MSTLHSSSSPGARGCPFPAHDHFSVYILPPHSDLQRFQVSTLESSWRPRGDLVTPAVLERSLPVRTRPSHNCPSLPLPHCDPRSPPPVRRLPLASLLRSPHPAHNEDGGGGGLSRLRRTGGRYHGRAAGGESEGGRSGPSGQPGAMLGLREEAMLPPPPLPRSSQARRGGSRRRS